MQSAIKRASKQAQAKQARARIPAAWRMVHRTIAFSPNKSPLFGALSLWVCLLYSKYVLRIVRRRSRAATPETGHRTVKPANLHLSSRFSGGKLSRQGCRSLPRFSFHILFSNLFPPFFPEPGLAWPIEPSWPDAYLVGQVTGISNLRNFARSD